MFARLMAFVEADPRPDGEPLVMGAELLSKWVFDLRDHSVGRYTLNAALGSWGFMGALLEYELEAAPLSL